MKRKRLITVLILTAIAILACGIYYFCSEKHGDKREIQKKYPDRFFTVKNGDLQIGFTQTGSVNSQKKHKLSLQAAFKTKVIWVIDENTKVNKGDVVVKFETEDLVIKTDEFKLKLDNDEKDLAVLQDELRITESTGAAEIRTAEDALTEARDTYEKYRKLEGPKLLDQQKLAVATAKKQFEDASDAYQQSSDNLLKKVFISEDKETKANQDMLTQKQNMEKAEITYENAILDEKIMKRHSHPNKLTSLTNAVKQAELNLEKAKVKAASQINQQKNKISNLENQIVKDKRDYTTHKGYLEQMQIIAPVDGVVIYGDPDQRWGKLDVTVGMDVNRNQTLLTIPDMSRLIIEFDLAECFRSRIKIGDAVYIKPESIPDMRLTGKVSKIPQIPINLIPWDQGSPKIYKSTIEMDEQNPKLVSGMSVELEIVTEVLKNVLFAPVEAVFEEQEKFYVYRKTFSTPEKVVVQIGKSNDNYVEIINGLRENDIIYLYKPFQGKQEN